MIEERDTWDVSVIENVILERKIKTRSMNINISQCCDNHLSQWQIIAQGSKSPKDGYQVGISQENSTRSLC